MSNFDEIAGKKQFIQTSKTNKNDNNRNTSDKLTKELKLFLPKNCRSRENNPANFQPSKATL